MYVVLDIFIRFSDNYRQCEEYNATTSSELDIEEPEETKRKRKKVKDSDYVYSSEIEEPGISIFKY